MALPLTPPVAVQPYDQLTMPASEARSSADLVGLRLLLRVEEDRLHVKISIPNTTQNNGIVVAEVSEAVSAREIATYSVMFQFGDPCLVQLSHGQLFEADQRAREICEGNMAQLYQEPRLRDE